MPSRESALLHGVGVGVVDDFGLRLEGPIIVSALRKFALRRAVLATGGTMRRAYRTEAFLDRSVRYIADHLA